MGTLGSLTSPASPRKEKGLIRFQEERTGLTVFMNSCEFDSWIDLLSADVVRNQNTKMVETSVMQFGMMTDYN